MEAFSEEHSKCLLGKEWLVRTDNHTSTPYLLKFYSSTVDLSCCLLVTDTKLVWAEVLNSNQLARRWRDNQQTASAPSLTEGEEEEAWRATTLELLSKAHTIGGITDASFNVVPTNYSDFAFELDWDSFKWRWQTCFLGHKISADIISKYLIFPFISVSHLAFSSPDAISAMPDADLEKAVDKVGRTARRTVDTHIKNAISKPRLASTIRRMTAMFNFISDLPPVVSNTETPELRVRVDELQAATVSSSSNFTGNTLQSASMHRDPNEPPPPLGPMGTNNPQGPADSATDSEEEELGFIDHGKPLTPNAMFDTTTREGSKLRISPVPSVSKPVSDSESSPIRPLKKAKLRNTVESSSSAEEDSEEERKRRVALVKSRNAAANVKRGTKQPIKRGGKRF